MDNWRKVKSELPDKNRWVLVCYRSAFGVPEMAISQWDGEHWAVRRQVLPGNGILNFVRYWMPLPNVPADWSPEFWPEDGHDDQTGLFVNSPKIVYSDVQCDA